VDTLAGLLPTSRGQGLCIWLAVRLLLRSEFFNLLNRVDFSNPDFNGPLRISVQIRSARSPRVVQLALKPHR
jgi:hypothetical protein